jgi:hypothetical protein
MKKCIKVLIFYIDRWDLKVEKEYRGDDTKIKKRQQKCTLIGGLKYGLRIWGQGIILLR